MSINRRTFIKSSSALAGSLAAPTLLQAAGTGRTAPGDTVNVALIGCRGHGWVDLEDMFRADKSVQCLALCDVDRDVLKNRTESLKRWQEKKADVYTDYRRVLERKDIDALIIGTPDHWHCLMTVDACRAGKDVYVEKPMANSIAECDAVVAAAKRYGRVVQVGQQQRSAQLWHDVMTYLKSGRLGKIGRFHAWANYGYTVVPQTPDTPVPAELDYDMWLGPAPQRAFNTNRLHGLWRMFWNYGGGLLADWGVHLIDMGIWGLDIRSMPLKVTADGGNFLFPDSANETFETMNVIYRFDDFLFTWENTGGRTAPYGKHRGVLFQGTNGTLVADRESWEVYPDGDRTGRIRGGAILREDTMEEDIGHKAHCADFIACVKAHNMQTACTPENGAMSAKFAHLGNISARLGGVPIVYDDRAKRFVDNAQADQYLKPAYRSPWKFPEE
jgi:predicted dehydrogenase